MKSHFPLFSKLLEEKECAKAKYLEGENSLENYEHFIVIGVLTKWLKSLIF